MIKEKIIAAIKTRFPNVSFSKKRLEQVATVIAEDVIDDETKIDAAITTYNKYNNLTDLAKTDADIRGLNKKVGEFESAKGSSGKSETVPTDAGGHTAAGAAAGAAAGEDEAMPAWMKPFMSTVNQLTTAVTNMQKKESQATLTDQLKADKLKDVPHSFWAKHALPEKEEDVDNFVSSVKTDFQQFCSDTGFKPNATNTMKPPVNGAKAAGSGGGASGGAGKVDPAVEALFKNKEQVVGTGGVIKAAAPMGGGMVITSSNRT